MTAFVRTSRTIRTVKVPDGKGQWFSRTTRTRHSPTAAAMQRMVDTLGPQGSQAFDILGAVVSGRWSLPELHRRYRDVSGDLQQLRTQLADVDLWPLVEDFEKWVKLQASADTAAHYRHYLDELKGEDETLLRSSVTVDRLQKFLAARSSKVGTVRRYHVGLRRFCEYCVSVGQMDRNVMRDIKAPKAGKPRDRHLETEVAIKLADAQPTPFRTLSALLAGTGIDVSVALQLTRADVDVKHHEVRARGTKSHNRDRVVKVASWAWPYILRHLAAAPAFPSAPLFPDIDRWEAGDAHRDACTGLKIDNYTMRDARHTWAVRAARAGMPAHQIGRQLGHRDGVLALKVYGIYLPSSEEREHWEKVATARDTARRKAQ